MFFSHTNSGRLGLRYLLVPPETPLGQVFLSICLFIAVKSRRAMYPVSLESMHPVSNEGTDVSFLPNQAIRKPGILGASLRE